MGDLSQIRRRFMTTAVILGLASASLLVYLLWSGSSGPPPAVLQEQYARLKSDVALWEKSNPEKVRADLNQLYSQDVPQRWSEISQRMEKLTKETGVNWTSIHFPGGDTNKPPIPGIQEVKIETTVTGDYSKVASFINALEQDKLFFIIDKISVSGQEGGVVSLVITVDTFLRQPTA